MLAPTIRKIDEMIDAMACETNSLTASTSEVRLVSSLAGVTFSTYAYDCTEIFAASRVRRSFATRLRRVGLHDALHVGKSEDQHRDETELRDNRAEGETRPHE